MHLSAPLRGRGAGREVLTSRVSVTILGFIFLRGVRTVYVFHFPAWTRAAVFLRAVQAPAHHHPVLVVLRRLPAQKQRSKVTTYYLLLANTSDAPRGVLAAPTPTAAGPRPRPLVTSQRGHHLDRDHPHDSTSRCGHSTATASNAHCSRY